MEDIFLILYFVFTFCSLILSCKKGCPTRNDEKEDKSGESTWSWILELFILICAIALCFIGILYLGFKTNNKWIIILLASGALFEKIRTAHSSLKFLKKIVTTDETTPINRQDSLTILGGSYILWYLATLGYTKKLFSLVALIPNETMSDLLIMAMHIILCFLYLFFIFAILQNVFYNIALFIKKITGKGYGKNIFDLIDGSLSSSGFEIVSHPASLDYHTNKLGWKELMDVCLDNDYRSHDTETCGLHIHLSRTFLGNNEIEQELNTAKLIILFDRFWTSHIIPFSRRNVETITRWADKPSLECVNTETENEIVDKVKKYKSLGRYKAINLQNSETIEFRLFRGTLNFNTLMRLSRRFLKR